ncbi:MAG TPA: CHRD domain-containing protein [Longimicrobium sp.]|nr:CHRD domain-containing protein [Longimicrobium sp.]
MMIRKSMVLAALALAACEGDGNDDDERFRANLSGAFEVPAVTTTSTGTARFIVDGDELDYTLDVQNVTGAIAAHIHLGAVGANGPPVVFLFQQAAPGVNVQGGSLAAGSVDAADMIPSANVTYDAMLTALRNGNAYVNVHTVARPAGEIRGQVTTD